MQNKTERKVRQYHRARRQRVRACAALTVLALVVSMSTGLALIKPAATMENTTYCGIEAHIHNEECFEPVLICTDENREGHTHTDACWGYPCGLEEREGHTHNEECTSLGCGMTEAHVHTDCVDCTLAEAHTHDESCYEQTSTLICGLEESAEHAHGESCYETQTNVICDKAELPEHIHGEGCQTYVCGQVECEAHSHELCGEMVLICGLEEEEPHFTDHVHDPELCYEDKLICEKEEHEHVDACYVAPVTYCGLEEHFHSEFCVDENGLLVCGMENHVHVDECFVEPVSELMQLLPAGAEVPEGYTEEYSFTGEQFTVAVFAPVGALPEGAVLVADLLDEGSDAYAEAEAAVSETTEFDGMVAMDIRFELNEEEIEPELPVYVCINAIGLLPEEAVAETVEVHHIVETEELVLGFIPTGETVTEAAVVADATEDTGIVEAAENYAEAATDVTAAFEVESFSVFVATYTTGEYVYQEGGTDRYYLEMWQTWGDEAPEALRGQLVSCLDYGTRYLDGIVKINTTIPSEYGANGLVLGYDEAEKVIPFFPEGMESDYVGITTDNYAGSTNNTGVPRGGLESGDIRAASGITLTVSAQMPSEAMRSTTEFKDYLQTHLEAEKAIEAGKEGLAAYNADLKEKICGNFGATYVNVGMYRGNKIDLRITVMDYAISQDIHENSVIGLRVVGDNNEKKPGVCCVDIAWVELKYEFLMSGTDIPVSVKGNTSYYDVDGNQGVFMDITCKGIYVTDLKSDNRTESNSMGTLKGNKCALHLGWFEPTQDNSKFYRAGWGVYQGKYGAVEEETKYTSHAFTEAFEVGEDGTMMRVFNFEDEGNHGDGTIYHSGFPVTREGMFIVKKEVISYNNSTIDLDKEFAFTATLSNETINKTYGDLTFVNGEANFTLKHGEGVQATGLPVGLNYTVEEAAVEGYTTTVNGEDTSTFTGTVKANVEVAEIPTANYLNVIDDGDLILDKTVKEDGTQFSIDLSAYVTGSNGNIGEKAIPTDIILVLDESGSMDDCVECGHEIYNHSRNGVSLPLGQWPEKGNQGELVIDENENQISDCAEYSKDNNCKTPVYKGELDTSKHYLVFYTNGPREVFYCPDCANKTYGTGAEQVTCSGWFTYNHDGHANGAHDWTKQSWWDPFTHSGETADYMGHTSDGDGYCVQFYEVCAHNTTRKDVLITAVTSFLNNLKEASLGPDNEAGTEDDVVNRVALVGFSSDAHYLVQNGEMIEVQGADGNLNSVIVSALNDLGTIGGTYTGEGMEFGADIAEKYKVGENEERNLYTILFTDGSPGSGYKNSPEQANKAIAEAKTIKDLGIPVYAVGLFPGADCSLTNGLPEYDYTDAANGNGNIKFFQNGNRVLHLISSNYPSATDLGNPGTASATSYYLSTETKDGLYNIFDDLTKEVVTNGTANAKLDMTSILRDVVSDEFEINGTVTAWTESFVGFDDDGNRVFEFDADKDAYLGEDDIKVTGNTVEVNGFDYSGNFVHTVIDQTTGEQLYNGKRIVVNVPIRVAASNVGGTKQATNDHAEIEHEHEIVDRFPDPYVDVPTTVTIRKIVSGTTTAQEFDFTTAYTVVTGYENIDSGVLNGSNYLHALTAPGSDTAFKLPHEGERKLTGVAVGTELRVAEGEHPGYHLNVEITYLNTAGQRVTAVEGMDYTRAGDTITFSKVKPGMVITFTNATGPSLPSTGGMGTTVFYIVGAVLMLGAVVFLVARKKMGKEE